MNPESFPVWDKNFALTNEVLGAVANFNQVIHRPEAIDAIKAAGNECRSQLGDFAEDDLQLALSRKDPEQFTTALELEEVLKQLHGKMISYVSRARIKEEERLQKVQDHWVTLDTLGAWKVFLLVSEPNAPPATDNNYPETWDMLPIIGMADFRVVDMAQIASEQIGLATSTYNYEQTSLSQN
ncbi:MAG: hypothetical protein QG553_843 [Patescibacteria group bacterium]|nr:hypothetical protein [Patescibacteria group bacterium]